MKFDLDSVRAFFKLAPFMEDLGVVPVAVGDGRVTTSLPLLLRHMQHSGQAHAGVSASLADHSMGAAAQSLCPADRWVVTAELKTSLLRPARGERLICEAVVIKPGRTLMFCEADVFAEDQEGHRSLVAKASATMAVIAVAG
jgi:uncharacterized protein (TIGR00369 family)